MASFEEIEQKRINLNIPRYVDTFEPEEEIDLNAVSAEIRKLQREIKDIDAELKTVFLMSWDWIFRLMWKVNNVWCQKNLSADTLSNP